MAVLSLEEVLAQEADAIDGGDSNIAGGLSDLLKGKEAQRSGLDSDDRDGTDVDAETIKARNELYRALNELNRAALCLSGGGIRSAVFCLGVIQALAAYEPPETPAEPRKKRTLAASEDSFLGRFHYLSTVSGGGYIGSWLSSWRIRENSPAVFRKLASRPNGADVEPSEISWLRAYRNYSTPRVGIASPDARAAVVSSMRNMLLIWLIIIPVVCLPLLLLKLIATASISIARHEDHAAIMNSLVAAGAFLLIIAHAFTTRHRPARQHSSSVTDKGFILGDLAWAAMSAILFTVFLSSRYFQLRLAGWMETITEWTASIAQFHLATGVQSQNPDFMISFLILPAVVGLLIYLAGWIASLSARNGVYDLICWAASGAVYGALVGLGAYFYYLLEPYAPGQDRIRFLLIPIIFGVPWILIAQLFAEIIFAGLVSYETDSDADQEWLGRAADWLAVSATAWGVTAFLVFGGVYVIRYLADLLGGINWILATGGATAIATALLSKGSQILAKRSRADQVSPTAMALDIGLAVVSPIFVALLILGLSVALDYLLFRDSLILTLRSGVLSANSILWRLIIGCMILEWIAVIASTFVNINRFSPYAFQRDRLIRGYLAGSRQVRDPDLFTGFDSNDDVHVHELWPEDIQPRRLFHVINITLDVVSTKRLAWLERKPQSFTVSPLHCGSAHVGFRASKDYGGSYTVQTNRQGISLGTAMAISGAGGPHASPSIAQFLTPFNVRLGWWLGNPGPAGDRYGAYRREGPRWAATVLFQELLGQTTDQSPYVYLSDGGHFEALGLYEMVRRRCRLIVVVDAGCDPDFDFEDLGNAVRKIYIDLGVRVTFSSLGNLLNRPTSKQLRALTASEPKTVEKKASEGDNVEKAGSSGAGGAAKIPYHAIGTIDYQTADGPDSKNGTVIYIKPAYHGTEGAAVRSYATANKTFPHETTADQWFTESQFESYRALGLDIGHTVLCDNEVWKALHEFLKP
jgi:Patatin-like phospholipase